MTANELAVDLELQSSHMEYGYAVSDWKLLSDSATMLRQQQAEIQALHNLVKEQDKKIIDLAFDLEYARRADEFRELTEEEIKEVYDQYFDLENFGWLHLQCIREILEKAREK